MSFLTQEEIDEIFCNDFLFDDESSFENPHLEKAIAEMENIKNEIESTIDYVQQLSEKYLKQPLNYLQSITPAGQSITWAKSEYLKHNVDAMINEERQKHDSSSPQQDHKVQEINDDFSSLTPSTASSYIINHQKEVEEGSECEFEGVDEDEKSSDQQSDECGEGYKRSVSQVKFVYNKLVYEKIKLQYQLGDAHVIVKRMMTIAKARAIAARNYSFKKEAPRFKIPLKNVVKTKLHRRTSSSSSSERKNPPKLARSVTFLI